MKTKWSHASRPRTSKPLVN